MQEKMQKNVGKKKEKITIKAVMKSFHKILNIEKNEILK